MPARPLVHISRSNFCRRAVVPLLLLVLPCCGCYQDRNQSYRAVTDDKGEIAHPEGVGAMSPVATPDQQVAAASKKGNEDKKAPGTPDENDFGIPFYPGAKTHTGLDGQPKASKDASGIAMIVLETTDTAGKVLDYYREKMPKADYTEDTQNGNKTLSLSEPVNGNGLHSVEISDSNGMTRIVLMNLPPDASIKAPAQTSEPDASAPTPGAPTPDKLGAGAAGSLPLSGKAANRPLSTSPNLPTGKRPLPPLPGDNTRAVRPATIAPPDNLPSTNDSTTAPTKDTRTGPH